jgi:hypothetical protein
VITGNGNLPAANHGFSLDGRLSGTDLTVSTLSPNVATSIRSFRVELQDPVPAGTARAFQVRVDEVATGICDVPAGGTSCAQSATPIVVPAGATLRLVVIAVNNGGVQAPTFARWGMTIGAP